MSNDRDHISTAAPVFTGERFIPRQTDPLLALEHYHRYMFASGLVGSKRVVDIACGEGYGAAFLSTHAKEVFGVDNDEPTIRHAQSRYAKYDRVKFAVGRCEDAFAPGKSAEVLVSFETLEHLDAQAQHLFMKNIKKAMTGDGLLLISTPERAAYAEANRGENEFHKHEFSFEEFTAFLALYFKHITIIGQKPVTVSAMWELTKWKDNFFEFHIADDLLNRPASREGFTRPVYLIAACSDSPLPKNLFTQSGSIYYDTSLVEQTKEVLSWAHRLEEELRGQREYLDKLQKEFAERTTWAQRLNDENSTLKSRIAELQTLAEERTAWAKGLDKQLVERSEWTNSLQVELASCREKYVSLQKEFEERSIWAKSLDAELNLAKEFAGRLQKEFEERTVWAKSLDQELLRTRSKLEGASATLESVERRARELQLWGSVMEQQLNAISSSPIYKLLAIIGLVPKHRGTTP